ncbi:MULTISPECIES: Ku protein [unclassified Duganella]|uniref:non-homologous end joining protein Ku n=1 Tax=unclassified Duganella TaxID=2636909 RepID=UPI0007002BD0|nr:MULTISPECIES: Ku protein [unclassified Duganella]KQV59851.1 DNA repair protein [Duganella sp. Root336D2]KRB87329.1 DNA repair protein [Duganella sp. Root198D2]
MARALWKGAISFGLVHIPVELHKAVESHDLDLTMLDKRDFSPIGFKRYNKGSGKEVTWDNIVKGYAYSDGEYVVLSDEDLRLANPKATQTIDIMAFVDADSVPLTFYETPYYLAPGRGGDKVYALLRETLHKAGRIAIATVVIRTRQHLCALVSVGDGIIMNTLRYATEIRNPEDLKLPGHSGLTDKELKMALSLVEEMSEKWNPKEYHDTYREDVLKLVEKKVKAGQTHTITAPSDESPVPKASNVVDLVALLKQSLGSKGKAAAADEPEEDEEEAAPRKPRARSSAGASASKTRTSSTRATASSGKNSTKPAAKRAGAAKSTAKSTTTRRKAA